MTVKELIAELAKYPEDSWVYAYEGEITGVIVQEPFVTVEERGSYGHRQLGEIICEYPPQSKIRISYKDHP